MQICALIYLIFLPYGNIFIIILHMIIVLQHVCRLNSITNNWSPIRLDSLVKVQNVFLFNRKNFIDRCSVREIYLSKSRNVMRARKSAWGNASSVNLHTSVHFFIALQYYPFIPLMPCFFKTNLTTIIQRVSWVTTTLK